MFEQLSILFYAIIKRHTLETTSTEEKERPHSRQSMFLVRSNYYSVIVRVSNVWGNVLIVYTSLFESCHFSYSNNGHCNVVVLLTKQEPR